MRLNNVFRRIPWNQLGSTNPKRHGNIVLSYIPLLNLYKTFKSTSIIIYLYIKQIISDRNINKLLYMLLNFWNLNVKFILSGRQKVAWLRVVVMAICPWVGPKHPNRSRPSDDCSRPRLKSMRSIKKY